MQATEASQPHRPSSLRRRQGLSTLVLNADGRPLATWPLKLVPSREAVEAVWKDHVTVIETWEDAFYRSPSVSIPIPKVVLLRQYVPVHGRPKCCRASVFLRDRFRCQYCGERFGYAQLTYDHVVPRDRGGTTCWENVVAACEPCNARKKNRTDMAPLSAPRQPTRGELMRAGLEFLPDEVVQDFGSYLYWSTELRP